MDRVALARVKGEGLQRVTALGDGEAAGVVGVVVVRAQADQVGVVGVAAVGPVLDVMDLDESGRRAAGIGTATIPVLDESAQPLRDGPLAAPDRHRVALGVPVDGGVGGAAEPGGEVRGQRPARVDPGAFGVEVDVDAVVAGAGR